jgi:hypothetical protein
MTDLFDVPDPKQEYACSQHTKSTGFTLVHKWVLLTKKHPELLEEIELQSALVTQLQELLALQKSFNQKPSTCFFFPLIQAMSAQLRSILSQRISPLNLIGRNLNF